MKANPLAKKKRPARRTGGEPLRAERPGRMLEQVRQGEDQGQRVKTYIVISKPKRMSVKPGFVHIMDALLGGLKMGSG